MIYGLDLQTWTRYPSIDLHTKNQLCFSVPLCWLTQTHNHTQTPTISNVGCKYVLMHSLDGYCIWKWRFWIYALCWHSILGTYYYYWELGIKWNGDGDHSIFVLYFRGDRSISGSIYWGLLNHHLRGITKLMWWRTISSGILCLSCELSKSESKWVCIAFPCNNYMSVYYGS